MLSVVSGLWLEVSKRILKTWLVVADIQVTELQVTPDLLCYIINLLWVLRLYLSWSFASFYISNTVSTQWQLSHFLSFQVNFTSCHNLKKNLWKSFKYFFFLIKIQTDGIKCEIWCRLSLDRHRQRLYRGTVNFSEVSMI